jgi:phospholipid-transporting ATPase
MINNEICTSKYNWITFIPKNFIEQFSKLPNVYFLLIGFLQMIPSISTSKGVPVILGPLAFILIVTALKDLFEDLKRHRQDSEENNKLVLRVNGEGELEKVRWRELRVGDIVKIIRDEYFPADLLILKTSELKNVCYIETKNLDGETNLKNKKVHPDM